MFAAALAIFVFCSVEVQLYIFLRKKTRFRTFLNSLWLVNKGSEPRRIEYFIILQKHDLENPKPCFLLFMLYIYECSIFITATSFLSLWAKSETRSAFIFALSSLSNGMIKSKTRFVCVSPFTTLKSWKVNLLL